MGIISIFHISESYKILIPVYACVKAGHRKIPSNSFFQITELAKPDEWCQNNSFAGVQKNSIIAGVYNQLTV